MQAPHIVIIDENIHWLLSAKGFLESKGYFVVIKDEGSSGWNYLKTQPQNIDLVLIDFMVADMDGIDLLGAIRNHPAMQNMPVIMQGLRISASEIGEALALKAVQYIAKPYTDGQLISAVEEALAAAGKPLACLPRKPEPENKAQEKEPLLVG